MSNWIKSAARSVIPPQWLEAIRAARGSMERGRRKARIEARNRDVIAELLRRDRVWVELGAGGRKLEGWAGVDMTEESDLCLDLSRPLPLPDASVDQIYSSHTMEHFSHAQLMALLSECLRVLKRGGWIKIAVPNARIFLEAYQRPEMFDAAKFCEYKPAFHYHTKIDYVNYVAYMAGHHHHMFDEENLPALLKAAGFEKAAIRGFEPPLDLPHRQFESVYAVGYKPN